MDPRTIHYWAANGSIPVAFRKDKVVRFQLEDVLAANQVAPLQMAASLAPQPGETRAVELPILALSLLLGAEFPRISTVDLDGITISMGKAAQAPSSSPVISAWIRRRP